MTFAWTLDERKFLTLDKVRRLRNHCRRERARALRKREFLGVRDWFLIELGLNTGLRVQELSDLRCGDLLISEDEASLIVRKGKGNKRRPAWLSQSFKESCKALRIGTARRVAIQNGIAGTTRTGSSSTC